MSAEAMREAHGVLELWGGIECTVNRVGNRYRDQVRLSGHEHRISDIDRVAALGIRTLRYPLLWERIAPAQHRQYDWKWSDARLRRMTDLGITPIAGLLHHGSGPRYTSLLDPRFPALFTDFARAVAERYPMLRMVTPVNEPLTTARFSGLYGHWYPHHRSRESFVQAFLNQCVATRDAFSAMREVIPDLQLVQTEDVGRVYSTPALKYQADFENERRWLTFDALCGRITRDHPLFDYLAVDDAAIRVLGSLADRPCLPDMLGVNYYVTSERYLDDRADAYSPAACGGNDFQRYADVEAVRVLEDGIAGHSAILEECWSRYGIPLAVTEVHLGCTREQQMRWMQEAWRGAVDAREHGCDVRAVTSWALFGSFGWDSLVTAPELSYESGVFDIRSMPPRATALARLITDTIRTGESASPVVSAPGWWRCESRLCGARALSAEWHVSGRDVDHGEATGAPVLITGARGTLGSAFARICKERGLNAVGLSRQELDVTNVQSIRNALRRYRPWAVVNAAGFVRPDDAETQRAHCNLVNTVAAGLLAGECSGNGVAFVTFSSDLVFDGQSARPYVESDRVSPLNSYGVSKAAAEQRVLQQYPRALVIRTSAFFGPWDSYNFVSTALERLSAGFPVEAANDVVVSPTYVPHLVDATLDLLIDGESGIWHLANGGAVSWADFAADAARRAGLDTSLVRPVPVSAMGRAARQPRFSALGSERGLLLPRLDHALNAYFHAAPVAALS